MDSRINSQVIGSLIQDKNFSNWWTSSKFPIPFFDNQELSITFIGYEPGEDKEFLIEADKALANFLALGSTDRENISHLVYKNCMEFLNAVDFIEEDKSLRDIDDENEIWGFVWPSDIYVSRRPYREPDIYVQIACECDWEQEHGLQLIFRQGKKITRVSEQDGHLTEADAYGKADEEDELLAQF
ncbi:hypothetical protein GO988_15245 [Hymenobacter sp. HMF4947]|uniref:DUF6985 domain-containing protein n=1 Tax=Hymenobacter ginkgonis TaxID=2682976 RepID=A0A7K1TGZ0_9BACT|nr:hypothetical protein [Hymenobacter ginkgonis]MVN77687.1 hypothetical protein [Hymenobacter ginkgonis]